MESGLQLWVGLGNPGAGYSRNRHNIGYMAVEAIASCHGFAAWKAARFDGLVARGQISSPDKGVGSEIILLKPTGYMNQSGIAVAAALRYYRIKLDAVTVFHDELDLAPGRLRVKRGGGAAGHNGLRSIDQCVGADYRRVRLGIGHPGAKELVSPFVLGNFSPAETHWLSVFLQLISDNAPKLLTRDDQVFATAIAVAQQKN
ncbi:MAG: aminoacyl-tRNA hydrolase [Alphaproteobacteria bacterium]|nr:aminoacyl-tRNA hydrolase [Alphaproteobacteria bacterium]